MLLPLLPLSYYVPLNLVAIILNAWSVFSYFGLYITLILTTYVLFPYVTKFVILCIRVLFWVLNKVFKRLATKLNISLKKRPLDPIVIDWIDEKVDAFVVTF